MFDIPNDIVQFFFDEIHKKGKYKIVLNNKGAIIMPRSEEAYYKPNIEIKDIEEFRVALYEYVIALTNFYTLYDTKQDYHDLSYFFNMLLFNMVHSDTEDLTKFIYKRICFFNNEEFSEYSERSLIAEIDSVKYYVQRIVEEPGLETPFILVFDMECNGVVYPLPLVRYAIDKDKTCHLFAIQFGKNREYDTSKKEYKNIVNNVNTGINKYRNVSPSFVLSFALFLKLLTEKNITDIKVPGFLFARYKHYFKAKTTMKSNLILNRILNKFVLLMQRMEFEVNGFEIKFYLEEFDSYTHIKLNELNSKNNLVKRILTKEKSFD